jgi:hypothetical protein
MLRWEMVLLAVQFALALEGTASAFCSQMAASGLVARRVDVCQHGGHLPVPWGWNFVQMVSFDCVEFSR